MNNGYIKLYRKILDNPIVMKDTECLAVWIYLLLNATHKEKSVMFKGKRIALKPGQLITGIISISKKMKINKDKVQRTLKLFENDKQIEQQTSNKNRLITIVNWDLYQDFDKQNDKQVINNCETTDKQVITNNKDKNVINISSTTRKNEINAREEKEDANGRYGNERNGDESLLEFVEKSFGRTINGIEAERILSWEDTELTRYAVSEAVLSQAFNVKYIERILERYKREGYKSVADIVGVNEPNATSTREQSLSKEEQEILNYNWLE
jgi:DnaD/phage-associated family protein